MPAILPLILGGAAAINAISGAKQGHDANKLRQRALSLSEQDFADRGPARDAALKRLLGPMPERPDLSAGFQDPGNPFAQVNRQAMPVGPTAPPVTGPVMGGAVGGGQAMGPVMPGDMGRVLRMILQRGGQGGGQDFAIPGAV